MAESRRLSTADTYNAASDTFDSPALSFWSHYGRQTVQRLGLNPGGSVLDVACGTGSSAIPAAQVVGEGGSVTGVDLAVEMLALARRKAEATGLSNIRYLNADMKELDFPDGSFDAVVCVFGVFFVSDMDSLVADLWRMVKPGGRLAITSWSVGRFEPLASAFEEAVKEVRPDLASSSEPWKLVGSVELLRDLLNRSGVENVEVSTSSYEVKIDSPDDWWQIVMGSGSRWKVEQMTGDEVETVQRLQSEFITANRIESVPTSAIYGTGTKTPI